MSTVSAGAPEGRGFGSVIGGGAGSVTGATTLFVLVMAIAIVKFGGDAQRVLLSSTLALSFYAVITFAPRIGIPGILIFLNFIGIIRRYSVPILGYSSMDALLLITPIATALFILNHLLNRKVQTDTRLAKLVGWLAVIMLVQMFNPFQGGLVLGLMGVMTFAVPLLWFYIGRTYFSKELLYQALNLLIALACIGAAYGLWQTFFGFTDVEKEWMAITRTDIGQALNAKFMRVFSTYSSFAEYVRICNIAAAACLALMKRNRLYVLPFLLCATSIFLSSSRGSLLTLAATIAYVWAFQGKTPRLWIPRLAVAAAVAGASLVFGLSSASQSSAPEGAVGTIITHQANGILKATDTSQSTAGGHLGMTFAGILSGFKNPLGYGIGASTIHAGGYSSNVVASENDIGNMFGSLGAIGGVIWVLTMGYSCYMTGSLWNRYRDPAVLAVLVILIPSIGTWMIAGQYFFPVIIWLLIGILDGFYAVEQKRLLAAGGNSSKKRYRNGMLLSNPQPVAGAGQGM